MASYCSVAIAGCQRFGRAGLLAAALALASALTACTSGVNFDSGGPAGSPGAAPPTELITDRLIELERLASDKASRQDLSPLFVAQPPPYTIGRGDILSIVVWDHPELAAGGMSAAAAAADNGAAPPAAAPPGFAVDHRGQIQFPLIGLLVLEGLTADQARTLLAKKLARYIAHPSVTLRVQAYRSRRVYVDGEVRSPGLQAIDDIPMTLVEALNRAGGMQPNADQSRIVVERGETRYGVNLRELVQKGVNPGSILLAHGDVVRVHSRDESKVFVSGEVISPRALTMHNGRLTLNEALGESGGISPLSGDARQV